jgi:Cu(I)/Ag(I) efflux system periplasmic protein CusF
MKHAVNTISTTLTFLIASAFAQASFAQSSAPAATPIQTGTTAPTENAAKDMTDAEVRKVDADNGKITLKHGFIKSLDMPGMTMVFTVKDKAMLDGLAVGDKVQFAVEMVGGKFMLNTITK